MKSNELHCLSCCRNSLEKRIGFEIYFELQGNYKL